MGTGKNVVGKRIAGRLNMEYVSTDDMIEAKENRSIKEIFAQEGESYFRKIEKEIVETASGKNRVVIAAGGGVVLDKENVDNLKKSGPVVCLCASPEDILKRTKRHSHRPLLNVPLPKDKIKELLEERKPYYDRADYKINTTGKKIDQVVDEVIEAVRGKL